MIKLIFLTLGLHLNAPADSLRLETINGQQVIIHLVGDKETLYGLSKRYAVTVQRILEFNPSADGGLEVGQLLKVPYTPRTRTHTAEGTRHKVQPRETLFSISKMYGVSVDDIKVWNNLRDNSISVGQDLLVTKAGSGASTIQPAMMPTTPVAGQASIKTTHTVGSGETLYGISKMYNVTIDQIKTWNGLTSSELKLGQVLVITQPMNIGGQTAVAAIATTTTTNTTTQTQPATTVTRKEEPVTTVSPTAGSPVKISENVLGSDEVHELGLAELIEGTESSRKYLAMHRTAKAGTIIKIRNELNNREVFVRVAGTLPDTGVNDKLIVKISRSAYDRPGAIDDKFRVEVTYYK